MTLLGDATVVVYACWTLLLAGSSLTLFYLLFEHRRYVQHPRALLWLAVSLLLGIVGTVLETTYWAGVVADTRLHVLAWTVMFVGGVAYAVSMWLFARDVVGGTDRTAPFEEFDGAGEWSPGGRDAGESPTEADGNAGRDGRGASEN